MLRRPPSSPLFPYPPFFRSLLVDGDRDDLIATRVEIPDDRSGRLQRDLVLPGAPAIEDGDAQFLLAGIHARVLSQNCGGKRSEEHTSELQSQSNLVCRLLLE